MPRRCLFWSRRVFRWNYRHSSLIMAVLLLIFFFNLCNAKIRPVLTAVATTGVRNAVTAAINEAVWKGIAQQHISYADMVEAETDASGRISVLTSNLEQANRIRTEILTLVLEEVSVLSSKDFSIPVGNLTEIDLFSGRGPTITVRVLSVGTANASFDHTFVGAGVNQTLHQIMLTIDVAVQLLLPGQTLELPVSTEVCIAETIIVGEVPNTYLEWEQ